MGFSKKDIKFTIISGFITGLIVWRLLEFWGVERFQNISYVWLILVVPTFWVAGVWLGYFLSKWFSFFKQFGKYTAIGFTNAAIDFGVFNLLISLTGKALGLAFPIFKGISFLVAVTNSYFWNKYWTFEAGESRGGKSEAVRFFMVNIIAIVINIGVGSLIANGISSVSGFSDKIWANMAAVFGAAVALIFSFVGFKLVVFKRPNAERPNAEVESSAGH